MGTKGLAWALTSTRRETIGYEMPDCVEFVLRERCIFTRIHEEVMLGARRPPKCTNRSLCEEANTEDESSEAAVKSSEGQRRHTLRLAPRWLTIGGCCPCADEMVSHRDD